jgi:hypothetical protein
LYWRFTGGLYYEGVPEFANEVRIAENICSLRSFLSLTDGVEKVGDERGRSPCESFLTVTFRLVR